MKNKYYMYCRVCLGDKVKVHFSFYLLTISYQKKNKVLYTLASQEFTIDCAPPKWSAIPLQHLKKCLHNIQIALRFYFSKFKLVSFYPCIIQKERRKGDGVKTQGIFKCSYSVQSVGLDLHVNFLEFKSCVWSI